MPIVAISAYVQNRTVNFTCSLPHIQRNSPSLTHMETDLDCFPHVRIIAQLHPLYTFRKAVKTSAAGAVGCVMLHSRPGQISK